jgi:hypothetical protein
MAQIESGDRLAWTPSTARCLVRPSDDVLDAFYAAMRARQERRRVFEQPTRTSRRSPGTA